MSQFKIELASREDDADLRRILRENPMNGSISLTLRREPSFFNSLSVEGKFNQVIVARDIENERIVGFGVRSIKQVFVNGEKRDIGYLGCLRLDKRLRGTTLVPRGYKLFSELHKDKRAPFYLTTIVDDNEYAKKVLTLNRMGLPRYNDFGIYNTYIIPASKGNNSETNKHIIQAKKEYTAEIIRFINQEGAKKQFYPSYTESDLINSEGLLKSLNIEDIILHFDGEDIDGIMACWNQDSFKQTVVEKYSGTIMYVRPIINLLNKIKGNSLYLPSRGKKIDYHCASLIAIKDDNLKIFDELISAVKNRLEKSQTSLLALGLHSQDNLNFVAEKHSIMRFPTRLYVVTWLDGEEEYQNLDRRTPYLELGSL